MARRLRFSSDWISSNVDFFPLAFEDQVTGNEIDLREYQMGAPSRAKCALRSLGWLAQPRSAKASPSWTALFPHIVEPNALQSMVARVAADESISMEDGPSLAILTR